ncbi:8159_t:CDS:1, partial [Racocetra persica]
MNPVKATYPPAVLNGLDLSKTSTLCRRLSAEMPKIAPPNNANTTP